jgi:hypothetical protein
MYTRIINGIMIGRKGQSNVETLHNIIRTRHLPVQSLLSSSYKDDLDMHTISSVQTAAPCSILCPDEWFPYAVYAKEGIPVIITEPAGEEEGSQEEGTIFVLDL